MDNEFETEKPFIVTTADMLEIVAGGGNGSEYVDIVGLLETAAKELRTKDEKIERLREDRGNLFQAIGYALDLLSDGFDNAAFETLQDAWDASLKEKE